MCAVNRILVFVIFAMLAGCQPSPTPTGNLAGGGAVPAGGPTPTWPGRQADGSVLLPNQWSLRPVGRQVELGDFPVNVAVHPSGRYAAVLHCGYSAHQILVVDLRSAQVVSRTPIAEAFYGLVFARNGARLWCSGAGDEVVHCFDFLAGQLTDHQTLQLRESAKRGVPAGLAVDAGARQLYVANVWGHRVTRVGLGEGGNPTDILLGTNVPSTVFDASATAPDFDAAAATKRAEAALIQANPADSFPYGCALDEKRQRLYVSLWAQGSVAVIDLRSNRVIARWPTQEHPCEMVLTRSGERLFVANASRNTVTVLNTQSGRATETISAALYPNSPPGSTPNSLALTPDERTLFVANADNNAVAVFDVSRAGHSQSLGFIPVGWYPTSVRVTPDGKQLLVANGKGLTSKANPHGPQPGKRDSNDPAVQYIGSLFHGSLSLIDLPPRGQFVQRLTDYTAQAYHCSPLNEAQSVSATRPADSPIPQAPGQPSPIKYCLYVIKENRTYDQLFGDMPEGNGDPNLCLFPERVTPNHHRLAREFVLLDNFYVDSEVSADGHEWSMGAYATDFVEKTWPLSYGHNGRSKYPYPSEGNFPIAYPASGYLWDRARQAGVSYRSYGEFVNDAPSPTAPGTTRVPSLVGHFDEWYPSFDLTVNDVKRADRFISELKRFEAEGDMPQLQILRLPNDHTYGATRGQKTPTALLGDNDLALGRLVEAVSHSKFWPNTAIFVVEDDAQNGPDHVDAHRTVALVISPYCRRHAVDSTLYSTTSMVRTIELILGLQPMTQFDAAARPMFNCFRPTPDASPYTSLPTNVDLEERNQAGAWGGDLKLNFAREDAVDDLLLSEIVWRSVRGANSPMPAPVRAGFVFPHPKADDDD